MKIQRALLMAFQGKSERPEVGPLVHRVMDELTFFKDPVSVDQVSDTVEATLIDAGHHEVARSFMRYRLERDRVRAQRLKPDPDMLSGYIHVGKYARFTGERRELFHETVARSENMHIDRWPELESEIRDAFRFVHQKKGMPSMRSMQFAGEALLRDNARVYNCSFGHLSSWRRFQEFFYLLLCGCGVGYSVQWRHVDQLTEVKAVDPTDVCHYTIDDSIRGWADALGFLIACYTQSGCYPEFNYSKIRREGALLKTSGGRAPGHLPLKKCLEAVRAVLEGAVGRQVRPIEAHDIMCYTAEAVLAGGIRRSAMICLFSPEDTEMLYAKTHGVFRPAGKRDPGLNAQREMANNSAAMLRGSCSYETFKRVITVAQQNYGCPGFYFTNNLDYGPNPCGEIGMWPVVRHCADCGGWSNPDLYYCEHCEGRNLELKSGISFCNLTEVNAAACSSVEELHAATIAMARIGTMQAAYTDFDYLGPVTEAIVRREALLGVGMTGIMDNREMVMSKGVLARCAEAAVAENQRFAQLLGINPAARVTTIKPSGTASLELGGVSSGCHHRWARRYFHRVTANRLEPHAEYFRRVNPHMIEEKPNGDWAIVFPVQAPDDAMTVKDGEAMGFIDDVMHMYDEWICAGIARPESAPGLTHNVSCTVTVRDGELEGVIERIWDERSRVAAMSFVPYLLDARFAFAPRQAVVSPQDEARWNHLISLYKPIDWSEFRETEDTTAARDTVACAGGVCEL